MILDSSFLIELLREDKAAFEKGAELAESGIPQRIPAPVLYELQYGVEREGDADERRAIQNLDRLYPVVRLNERLARDAATLVAAADRDAGGVDRSGIDDVDDFRRLGVDVEPF